MLSSSRPSIASCFFYSFFCLFLLTSCPVTHNFGPIHLVDALLTNATVRLFNSSSLNCAIGEFDQGQLFLNDGTCMNGNDGYNSNSASTISMNLICLATGSNIATFTLYNGPNCGAINSTAVAVGQGDGIACLTAYSNTNNLPLFNLIVNCNPSNAKILSSSGSMMNNISSMSGMSSSIMSNMNNMSSGSMMSISASSTGYYTSSFTNTSYGYNASPSQYSYSFWIFAIVTITSSLLLIGIN